MAFYSEARRVVTEKTPFPYTPAQHALLLHPLKARGQATVDFPAADFWARLAEAYREAKVLLTVRDPQRWYDSASKAFSSVPSLDTSTAEDACSPRLWACWSRGRGGRSRRCRRCGKARA